MAKLHPAVVNMPITLKPALPQLPRHCRQEKAPLLRVKALHDYLADRIAYDASN